MNIIPSHAPIDKEAKRKKLNQHSAIKNKGSFKQIGSTKPKQLPLSKNTDPNLKKVIISRSHINIDTQKYISELTKKHKVSTIPCGSSLKCCLVAEGIADIYPRLSPTMEWDIAAAYIICKESKLEFKTTDNQPITFNKKIL